MLAAKPICVIKVSNEYFKRNGARNWEDLNKGFGERLPDYHVFVVPAKDDHSEPQELFEFQVFFDKDVTEISIEELKNLIKDSLN